MRTFDAATTAAIEAKAQTPDAGNAPKMLLTRTRVHGDYYKGETGGETWRSGGLGTTLIAAATLNGVQYVAYQLPGGGSYGIEVAHKENGVWATSTVVSSLSTRISGIAAAAYGGSLYVAYALLGNVYVWRPGETPQQIATTYSYGDLYRNLIAMLATDAGLYVLFCQNSNKIGQMFINATHSTWTAGADLSAPYDMYSVDISDANGLEMFSFHRYFDEPVIDKTDLEETENGLTVTSTTASYYQDMKYGLTQVRSASGKLVQYVKNVNSYLYVREQVDGTWGSFTAISSSATGIAVTGTTYFVGSIDGTSTVHHYYNTSTDLTHRLKNAKITEQIDNPILQFNVSLTGGEATYDDIEVGDKLNVQLQFGELTPIPMGVFYVDNVSYSAFSPTVEVSCRNGIGARLASSTDGIAITYSTMTGAELVNYLASGVGLDDVIVQGLTTVLTYPLTAASYYDNIVKVIGAGMMKMIELENGQIVFGLPNWLSENYRANGEYNYTDGVLFTRQRSKSVDALNTVFVASKGALYNVSTINNFEWDIPRRVLVVSVPATVTTQATFNEWVADQLDRLQYLGKTESYTSPIRPQLQTGDVAKKDGVTLGIVTAVSHEMGEGGYKTSFSVDSGGKIMEDGGVITTKSAGQDGFNRKQTLADIVKVIAKGAS